LGRLTIYAGRPTLSLVARDSSGETRGLGVHALLREEILGGELVPGSRLKAAELAGRFDVSMSVVREALTRLSEQGLVVSAPHAGFRVKPVSAEDLQDLTRLRTDIDLIGLRRSLEQGGVDWEVNLVAAHHKLSRTEPFADGDPAHLNEDWVAAHADFHQALIEGCGSPRLLVMAASLRDAAEIYRRWSFRREGTARDVAGEHQALLDASLDRDLARAEQILSNHLRRTADSLMPQLGIDPDGSETSADVPQPLQSASAHPRQLGTSIPRKRQQG
jgi:DNA-binding GntR family transcriptional regulator